MDVDMSSDHMNGSPSSAKQLKFIPKNSWISFDTVRATEEISRKIKEFNSLYEGIEGPTADIMLDDEEAGGWC